MLMRAVAQRVSSAKVEVEGEVVGEIERGLLVYLGAGKGDSDVEVGYVANKLAGLRVFPDDEGRMNRSLSDIDGELLVVSQFTLYGDVRKGRRPSFVNAARPDVAIPLYEAFVGALQDRGVARVETGEFGASMEVDLVNDGPVTLVLER